MNEIDRRIERAIMLGLNPKDVSPGDRWFAWYPVKTYSGWKWFCHVRWFRPLNLFTEYYDD